MGTGGCCRRRISFHPPRGGVGFGKLAEYVHSKGLKFGVHLMRGIPRQAVEARTPILGTGFTAADIADLKNVCKWNHDMYGVDMSRRGAQAYYDSVFKLFAEWGLDFVKVDDLSRPYRTAEVEAYRHAIDQCGRAMVLSMSPGGENTDCGPHAIMNANMWRITDDFWDDWMPLKEHFEVNRRWEQYSGPGHWPDPDMLPLGAIQGKKGWTRFSEAEQYTLMTLWAIGRSPLVMGGDLLKNDAFTLSLLSNDEVIEVDQHSVGGHELFHRGDEVAWAADVPGSKDKYLAVFNASDGYLDESKAAWQSDVIKYKTTGQDTDVDLDISGAVKLALVVNGEGGQAVDWVEPHLAGTNGEKKLTEMSWTSASTGAGRVQKNKNASGGKLVVGDQSGAYGLGVNCRSVIEYKLLPGYSRFKAKVGLDRGGAKGSGVRCLLFLVKPESEEVAGRKVSVSLGDLGFAGACEVRDLWKHEEVGVFNGEFGTELAWHGAGLFRVSPKVP